MSKFDWHKLATTANIPESPFRVLMRVFDYSGPAGEDAYPSRRQLVEECQLSESTVQRALKWLVQAGWLRLVKRGGRAKDGTHWASEYTLSTPAGIPNPLHDAEATRRKTRANPNPWGYGEPHADDPWAQPEPVERGA